MITIEFASQATPKEVLHEQLMNSNVAKNEREWYASHLIESLQSEISALKKQLETKWTDEDMKQAFLIGGERELNPDEYFDFNIWLAKYKSEKGIKQ